MQPTPAINVPSPPPASVERPTRVRYGVMAFLCALSFLTYFDRVCIVRAQNDIQQSLRIDDEQMGLIFGAFWLAYALFEIPSGWIGDRFGPRRGLGRIVLAWSLFTALSGSAVGFASLLLCRFCFGAGEAGAYPNMAKIQAAWLPVRSRARAGGLLWLFARWGAAFSPVIFGAMLRGVGSPAFHACCASTPLLHGLNRFASWRLGFWLAGLLGLAWLALFLPWFKDRPADKLGVNAAELDLINRHRVTHPQPTATPRAVWAALFRSPSLWALAILYLCGSFGYSFFVSWMPKYFERVLHVPFEKSEWISAAPQFCAGISCLAGGWLSDILVRRCRSKRLARAILPVIGCVAAALAMYGVSFARTPRQAVVLMCIAAAAYDLGQGANWASIIDIGGARAGIAAGFVNMIGNTGNFTQPVIGAAIFKHLGWPALFLSYAAAYLVAAMMWVFINPTRTFHDSIDAGTVLTPDNASPTTRSASHSTRNE